MKYLNMCDYIYQTNSIFSYQDDADASSVSLFIQRVGHAHANAVLSPYNKMFNLVKEVYTSKIVVCLEMTRPYLLTFSSR